MLYRIRAWQYPHALRGYRLNFLFSQASLPRLTSLSNPFPAITNAFSSTSSTNSSNTNKMTAIDTTKRLESLRAHFDKNGIDIYSMLDSLILFVLYYTF